MRLIFSILTGIVVIIAALVLAVPMFISTDDLRNELFARVEQMTGYRLRVSGPLDITVFPSIALVAEDVGIAQPTASGDAEFAKAKKVRFDLKLAGLLQGNYRVREVTLVDPVVAIPQTMMGAAPQAPAPQMAPPAGQQGAAPQAMPPAAPAGGSGSGMAQFAEQLKSISLDKLVIKNGTVTLPSSGGKPGTRIEKLDLTASLPGYNEPLTLDTSAVVDGKTMKLGAVIGNFGPFLGGASVPVRLNAHLPGTLDDPVQLSGAASFKNEVFTLSQFSAKSGNKTLSGTAVYRDGTATLSQLTGTMGHDTFAGNVVYKDNIVTVNPLRANVRGTVLAGQLQANLANKVPYVVAAIGAKTLDINALTGGGKSSGGKSSGAKPGSGGGAKKGGGAASTGWSNEKIDLSVLKAVNGKLNLRAEQLIYDQVKIKPITLQATLNGGKLNATLSKFGLYQGTGNASLAVDASRKTPAHHVKLNVTNFDGRTLLKDVAAMERIDGKGTLVVDLNASGASQRAMVGSLGGTASVEFKNGAIRGMNVAKMIRSLGQGALNGWQGGAQEKTDFASLGATFKIAKGQATTDDLHLLGPLVRVTGSGTVNLPQKTLKLRVDPQLVASLEGQGGQQDVSGLGVPVMIVGPWAKPKIYPDIKGILENPAEAIARYKQFGKDLKKLPGLGGTAGTLEGVVKDGKIDKGKLIEGIGGLLGGTQAAPTPNAAPQPKAAPAPNAATQNTQQPKKQTQTQTQQQTNNKKKKVKPEDIGKQLLNNWLSGQ
ncbi:AsmA family protein [Methyloceanibacter sp.]|uniref:AsmA family protein n=1 Tax=Methyloceanibacter sp. TaxID=1965321 RepID=UPI002C2648A6|nr:AsmA family protein [Methyloceanibacter sp.]HML93327.1 AsmA family protein [Methyloceanibacter sp.]